MAVYTVSNTGGNYNIGTAWVGGVAPSTTDSVAFTSTSGNLTINVASTCAGINFTNYVGLITINTTLNSTGAVNFGTGGYTVGGSNSLFLNTSCTITSNGTTWNGNLQIGGTSQIFTLADDLRLTGTLTFSITTSCIINGFSIYTGGVVTIQNASNIIGGTTAIRVNNSCTWTHNSTSYMNMDVYINANVTFSANGLRYGTTGARTLTYISGTLSGTVTLTLLSCTLDLNTSSWSSASMSGTITLISDVNVSGSIVINQTLVLNGVSYKFYIGGGLSRSTNTSITGTSAFELNGTGNWTDSYPAQGFSTKLIINTAGTITIGSVGKGGTFTYVAGTVTCTGTVTLNAATILDVNGDSSPSATVTSSTGINFNNLNTTGGYSHTVTGNIRVCGTHTAGGGNFTAGTNIYNSGNYTVSSNTGSALYTVIMNGTGTWSGSSGVRHHLTINTSGIVTISGSVLFTGNANAIFTYTSGTVVTTGSTLFLGNLSNCILNTDAIVFDTIILSSSYTTTLNSTLNAGTIQFNSSHTFAGAFGFVCNTLTSSGSYTINLKNGTTYVVNSIMNLSNAIFKSSTASSYAFLNVGGAVTMNNTNNSVTDIDSSGGQTVVSPLSTFTRTINWSLTPNLGNFFLMF